MGFITFLLIISLYFSNVKSFVTNKSKSTKYTKFSSNIGIDPISSEFSFAERLESLKIAVSSGIAGTLGDIPFLISSGIISDFDYKELVTAPILYALFGLVYRYAIRRDSNPNLKQGVIGAFALTKAINIFHYNDQNIILINIFSSLLYLFFALFSYSCAAEALESGFRRKILFPFPKE